MDGEYYNKKSKFLNFLQNWVNQVINDKLWEKYVDLHINEIDKKFEKKQNWIKGGLFLLNCILSLIDRSRYDVFLVIPLSCTTREDSLVFTKLELLEEELDITPPSFYLFPKGERNYLDTIKNTKYLDFFIKNMDVYYKEEEENGEVYRTIYIKST